MTVLQFSLETFYFVNARTFILLMHIYTKVVCQSNIAKLADLSRVCLITSSLNTYKYHIFKYNITFTPKINKTCSATNLM